MNIIKDERSWKVILIMSNKECPFLYFPRNEHACTLLRDKNLKNELCNLENCPRRME